VLCQSYASMPWCLVTDIDYVNLGYLHSRVFTVPSFVSAMVDGILCMTVIDLVPKPSVNPTVHSVHCDGSIENKSCAQLRHFAGRIAQTLYA
jgi:hypothetical protein